VVSELEEELENLARNLGSDLFGISNLETAHDFIETQGGQSVAGFPRAVTIGIRLVDAVVDELCQHEERSVLFTYRGLYSSVNANLDRTALLVGKKIQEMGCKAYPIPASQTSDPTRLQGVFSHKLAAHLSGLGWIGKSCLLITPDHGPRVRLATVLTDAPLKPGAPLASRCGDCNRCVEICPAKAFTGIPFNPSEPRDARFKARLCKEYSDRRAQLFGEGLCGLCVYICPYGTQTHVQNSN
jgi:epoxyqueuosine reductase